MPAEHRNTYAGNPLNRVARERRSAEWIATQLARVDLRVLPLWRLQIPCREDGGGRLALAWQPRAALDRRDPQSEPLLLGTSGGVPCFAIDVSALDDPAAALAFGAEVSFQEPQGAVAALDLDDSGVTAQARAFVGWHARHPHCAVCGGRTAAADGGIFRRCEGCETEHFPRTDPVVITVVGDADRCLLGRQASWPPGMYSALAGFVDQGESIEDAVRREIAEEAGIGLRDVRYHSSQPWPYPASLMIGCHARPASTEIDMDEVEMDDVRWFERAAVLQAIRQPSDAGLRLPPPTAIAHTLIRAWALDEV